MPFPDIAVLLFQRIMTADVSSCPYIYYIAVLTVWQLIIVQYFLPRYLIQYPLYLIQYLLYLIWYLIFYLLKTHEIKKSYRPYQPVAHFGKTMSIRARRQRDANLQGEESAIYPSIVIGQFLAV